jgi:hypothetical protein
MELPNEVQYKSVSSLQSYAETGAHPDGMYTADFSPLGNKQNTVLLGMME